MAVKNGPVLEPRQLNDADVAVLAVLEEGRASPGYLEERTDYDSTYVSQRLRRLEEHSHVRNVHRGLWELVDDPRADIEQEVVDIEALQDRVAELEGALRLVDHAVAEIVENMENMNGTEALDLAEELREELNDLLEASTDE